MSGRGLVDEVERLRAWKREAMTLFDGMQDLGRALGLPLGALITGPVAIESAKNLRAKVAAIEALADEFVSYVPTGRLRDALATTAESGHETHGNGHEDVA